MKVRTTLIGIMLLTAMIGLAAPADAGWIQHTDQSENSGRVLGAEASDLVRWSSAVNGVRRWATFAYGRGRATVQPSTDHLCLRSTFVGVGNDVNVDVEADYGHVSYGDHWTAISFRSCGGRTQALEAVYPRVTFTAAALHRVDHILRVDATSADPPYVGSFTTKDSQLATQAAGEGPPEVVDGC